MEDTLGEFDDSTGGTDASGVLILILMEDTLGVVLNPASVSIADVLILILMEDTLGDL